MNTYSWGEFYETTKNCIEYNEEIKRKFAVFEALDNAITLNEIKEIIDPLTENEINWLNSPCLDGIILGLKYFNPKINLTDPIESIIREREDNPEACKYFLQKRLGICNMVLACDAGLINTVKLFLDNGATVGYSESYTTYPLTAAATYGYTEIVKLLIERGANIHANSESALCQASLHGHTEVVKLLLEKGANLYPSNWYISSGEVLANACKYGHVDTVKFLLEYGVNIHVDDDIALRSSYRYPEIIQLLLERKANIHSNDDEVLRQAVYCGCLESVKLLLKNGADIHINNDIPFRSACRYGCYDIVKFLLENGANIHASHDDGLLLAVQHGHVNIVELLLKNGAKSVANILEYAIENRHIDIVKLLLNTGLFRVEDLSEKIQKEIEIVKMLLEFGKK